MCVQRGNLSLNLYLDGRFTAEANQSGSNLVLLSNGTYGFVSLGATNADCASFDVRAEAPVDMYVIRAGALGSLLTQIQA